MSYARLLTHRCDIYHLKSEIMGGNYGVPGEIRFYYGENPDIPNAPCYFTEKSQSISQGEPNNTIIQPFLVHFLLSTNICLNDKVIWNGIELKLQVPRKIKNHHWEVSAVRQGDL
jgi:hypothetical protein